MTHVEIDAKRDIKVDKGTAHVFQKLNHKNMHNIQNNKLKTNNSCTKMKQKLILKNVKYVIKLFERIYILQTSSQMVNLFNVCFLFI